MIFIEVSRKRCDQINLLPMGDDMKPLDKQDEKNSLEEAVGRYIERTPPPKVEFVGGSVWWELKLVFMRIKRWFRK